MSASPKHPAPSDSTALIRCTGWLGLVRRIQCKLGLCGGHIEHERDKNGVWWLGLRCTATGKLHDPVKSKYQDERPNTKLIGGGDKH
jgi:hypothetical protein